MSPEQVRKEPVDARSDLFSFGAVFYEMATGRQAFCGESQDLIHDAILNYTPPSLLVWNPDLPAELESVIVRALEKDRQKRYQSAAEISADLQQLRMKESELASSADGLTPVEQMAAAGSGVEDRAATPTTRVQGAHTRDWRAGWLFTLGAALLVAAAIWFWRREAPPGSAPELQLRRLTSNSNDDPVQSGTVSADGKYLAFADLEGMHVRILETGETHNVPQPKEFEGRPVYWQIVGWFPGGTSFIANSTLSPEYEPQQPSVWEVSSLAGQPRKIREDAEAWSISPDGSMIAFSLRTGRLDARTLWVMGSSGERARKLFDVGEGNSVDRAQWSPDGQRLAYVRIHTTSRKSEVVIESRDLMGGDVTVILSAPEGWVQAYLWLPDGRIIYSMEEPSATDCNFWTLRIDSRTGRPTHNPRKLTNWAGFCVDALSVTGDTKKLAFVESAVQGTVHVADVHDNGPRVDNVRPLTPNQGWSQPSAWSADSKTVVVRSNRDGRWRIYKRPLDGTAAEPLIREPEKAMQARVLGSWVIYQIRPKGATCTTPVSVLRLPFAGGSAEEIVKAPIRDVRCGRVSCITLECSQDFEQYVFRSFDPIQGLGRELARVDGRMGNASFSPSPDGTQIAFLPSLRQSIDIYPVSGAAPWKVKVKDWPTVDNVNWAADGKGFYVFSPTPRRSVLLHVDLEGNAHVLWKQLGGVETAGIPSPDGRHLARHFRLDS